MADPTHQKPQHEHPEGMEPYDLGGEGDLGALSKEQQEKLNRFKVIKWSHLCNCMNKMLPK